MAIDTDSQAVFETSTEQPANEYTTSMGVVLKLQKISHMIVAEAIGKMKEPRPPLVLIKAQGDNPERTEENFADPEYLDKMQDFTVQRGEMTAKVFYTLGTKIVSVPEGFDRPEDDDWVASINALGEVGAQLSTIPEDKKSKLRYYYWLKYWATNERDFAHIVESIMKMGGGPVLEVKVAEALDTFRGDETRDTASGVQPTEQS